MGFDTLSTDQTVTIASIVLLAMIAAFLGLRLYSVLGKRTGHEQDPILPRTEERTAPRVLDRVEPLRPNEPAGTASADALVYEPAAEMGVRALLAADRSFSAGQFVEGARNAYRMILEAFWAGDRATLRDLCDEDSYDAFDAAIAAREDRGETLDNRLVAIETARISDALLDGSLARVTVRFDADIAAVTRDAEGRVIAGSLTDAVQTHDHWTFVRDIKSADPNWKLDETQAD